MSLKGADRRDAIAEYILRAGYARIEEIADHFTISRMTVHRHVETLTKQGIVRKLHGAVTAQPSGLYESAFKFRKTVTMGEKRALARAALQFVEPGQAIMLDDSTTDAMIVGYLDRVTPLTVVTNSVDAAEKLHTLEDVEIISLGGSYNRVYNAYVGLMCEQAISRLRVNTVFLSASAVSGTQAFIQDQQIVRIKQAMMGAAQKKILLLVHNKFDRVALHSLGELSAFDAVLVTKGLSQERQDALRDANVRLQIVDWDENSDDDD